MITIAIKNTEENVADVFLVNFQGSYLGRTCLRKKCNSDIHIHCNARNCRRIPYLNDDLDIVDLNEDKELMESPLVELWPSVITRILTVPDDVSNFLLVPLQTKWESCKSISTDDA